MRKKPLAKLLYDVEQELLRLGYTEGSMKFYRTDWNKDQELLSWLSELK